MSFERYFNRLSYIYSKRPQKKFNCELKFEEIKIKFKNNSSIYSYFHHFFWNIAPIWLREHREYFKKENRGFGEDAFHAMWYKIFEEFRPQTILEIGVYRGQTISLFSLLAMKFNIPSRLHAISPFTPAGDSVSVYLKNLDYLEDVKKNHFFFNLPLPVIHKGFSTDNEIIDVLSGIKFDLIYIDGNHDYSIAKHDFEIYSKMLNPSGLIVFDDASLYSDFKPPSYASAGHDGPSRVVNEINRKEFREIIAVGHNVVFQKESYAS